MAFNINTTGDASAQDPAYHAAVVTKSDTVDLTDATTGLWVGGDGNINVIMLGGETVLFSGIPSGTWLPIRVTRVLDTDTSATLIVACWRTSGPG